MRACLLTGACLLTSACLLAGACLLTGACLPTGACLLTGACFLNGALCKNRLFFGAGEFWKGGFWRKGSLTAKELLVIVFVLNSRYFKLKISRTRMFFLALDPAEVIIVKPIEEWADQLDKIAQAMPEEAFESLPDNHPAIKNMFEEFKEKRAGTRRNLKEDCKWRVFSQAAWKAIGTLYGFKKPRPKTPWEKLLTKREFDTLKLHAAVTKGALGIDTHKINFIWDITNSFQYACPKSIKEENMTGCYLCHHLNWETKTGRPSSGFEQLLRQGFPQSLTIGEGDSTIKDSDFRHISGDTQTVPVIAAILMTAFSNIKFRKKRIHVSKQQLRSMQAKLPEYTWIGPSTFSKHSDADWLPKQLAINVEDLYKKHGFKKRAHQGHKSDLNKRVKK